MATTTQNLLRDSVRKVQAATNGAGTAAPTMADPALAQTLMQMQGNQNTALPTSTVTADDSRQTIGKNLAKKTPATSTVTDGGSGRPAVSTVTDSEGKAGSRDPAMSSVTDEYGGTGGAPATNNVTDEYGGTGSKSQTDNKVANFLSGIVKGIVDGIKAGGSASSGNEFLHSSGKFGEGGSSSSSETSTVTDGDSNLAADKDNGVRRGSDDSIFLSRTEKEDTDTGGSERAIRVSGTGGSGGSGSGTGSGNGSGNGSGGGGSAGGSGGGATDSGPKNIISKAGSASGSNGNNGFGFNYGAGGSDLSGLDPGTGTGSGTGTGTGTSAAAIQAIIDAYNRAGSAAANVRPEAVKSPDFRAIAASYGGPANWQLDTGKGADYQAIVDAYRQAGNDAKNFRIDFNNTGDNSRIG